MDIENRALSVSTLAKRLDVAPVTVRREIERGNLRATHVGRRVVIMADEVARYLEINTEENRSE